MANYLYELNDVKSALGKGLGLRTNKYLIEIPASSDMSKKMAVLAQGAELPARRVGVIDIKTKGRNYKIRGETEIDGTLEVTFIDDSNASLRKYFDQLLTKVDDTTPSNLIAGGSAFSNVDSYSILGLTNSTQSYQFEINVYQLSQDGKKVYGYVLQNAWISSIGATTFSDSEMDTLSSFQVTFSFSDFEPITYNSSSLLTSINNTFTSLGTTLSSIAESLFGF